MFYLHIYTFSVVVFFFFVFLFFLLFLLRREGGWGGTDTKTVCQTVSVEVKYKNATIYTMFNTWFNQISKNVDNVLSTNP